MKNFLIKWGILESPKYDKPPNQLEEAAKRVDQNLQIHDFLQKALGRYCQDCDEFFKRPQSLTMHNRFKHKGKEEA